jgi:hypothetical protein
MPQLRGRTATFTVEGRAANLAFAREVVAHCVREGGVCAVLDIDALYASNSDSILGGFTVEQARSVEVVVPEPGSPIEKSVLEIAASGQRRTVVIDSLNSLYHLLSVGARSHRVRELSFIVAMLSYLARVEASAVVMTMYRRERDLRFNRGPGISGLSDAAFTVIPAGGSMRLRCDSEWPGRGRLFDLSATSH